MNMESFSLLNMMIDVESKIVSYRIPPDKLFCRCLDGLQAREWPEEIASLSVSSFVLMAA